MAEAYNKDVIVTFIDFTATAAIYRGLNFVSYAPNFEDEKPPGKAQSNSRLFNYRG